MTKGIAGLTLLALLVAQASAQSAVVIKEIVVRGNSRITTDAIRATMRSAEGRPLIAADLERDQQTLRGLGVFKDVKVFSRAINDTEAQVIVDVEENPNVKEISIMGNSAIPTADIMAVVTQKTDAILNLNNRKTTADAIRALYEAKGFVADVDFPVQENSPETMVVMVVELKVHDIIVTGLNKTRPYVIDRMMKTNPGQPFNYKVWSSDMRRLYGTRWFESINPSPRQTGEIGQIDLLLDLKEQRTALFDVGLALDPQSRLAGTLRIRDTNFRGAGQSAGIDYLQDTFGSGASLSLDFFDPYFDNRDSQFNVSLYSRVNSFFANFGSGSGITSGDRFDERRTGGTMSLTRGFKGIYSTTLGVSHEGVRAVNVGTSSTNYILQDGTLTKVLLQGVRDTRDVPTDPFSGSFTRISFEPGFSNINKIGGSVSGFTDILGSNTFLRSSLEFKTFYSREPRVKPEMTQEEKEKLLTKPRDVIAGRVRLGTISGTVPFYEQLFVGGSDSLRGYADQRFWGRHQVAATLEYRHPIQDNFRVIGFMDYGGAWGGYPSISNFTQSDAFKLHLGYGAGVGFTTPLGQIRIDFGFTPEGRSRTHFTIGGTF